MIFPEILYIASITFLIMLIHSCNWLSVMTRGGAKRMMSPCVGFASNPLRSICLQTSVASYSGMPNHNKSNKHLENKTWISPTVIIYPPQNTYFPRACKSLGSASWNVSTFYWAHLFYDGLGTVSFDEQPATGILSITQILTSLLLKNMLKI